MKVPIILDTTPLSQKELSHILNSTKTSDEDIKLVKLALFKIDEASKSLKIKKEWLSAFVDFYFKTIFIHF